MTDRTIAHQFRRAAREGRPVLVEYLAAEAPPLLTQVPENCSRLRLQPGEHRVLCRYLGFLGAPAAVLLRGDRVLQRFCGGCSHEELQRLIEESQPMRVPETSRKLESTSIFTP